jgi:hypothetical protein
MTDSPYADLDKLIDEYEDDNRTLRPEKFIMLNYPKLFIMSVASLFENQIKRNCDDFIDHPLIPLSIHYPYINNLSSNFLSKSEMIYRTFYTKDNNTGEMHLDASKFYELFNGNSFKSKVKTQFQSELIIRSSYFSKQIDSLTNLLGVGTDNQKYERDYAKFCDYQDRISNCTFESAEESFLSIKYKRNMVAHDYINGTSDTFEDIRNLYLLASVYMVSLSKSIQALTDIDRINENV